MVQKSSNKTKTIELPTSCVQGVIKQRTPSMSPLEDPLMRLSAWITTEQVKGMKFLGDTFKGVSVVVGPFFFQIGMGENPLHRNTTKPFVIRRAPPSYSSKVR